ncbi:MAG: TraR/DksA C4-type zinc finger protein [Gemmatimonadota bacterium]
MDLDAVRKRLETDLRGLLSRHTRLTSHLRNEDRDIPSDWTEMAQFMENDEVLEALEERTRERVDAMARAIERIDEGIYMTCARCGGPIEPERLDVLPTTTVCAKCA